METTFIFAHFEDKKQKMKKEKFKHHVSGLLFELTGDYQMTFYVSGCINLVGCAVLLPVMVQRCRGVKPAIDANPTRDTGGR